MPDDDYVTMRLRAGARDEIRMLALHVAAAANRRVSQSEAVSAAVRLALAQLPAVVSLLPPAQQEPGDPPSA